MLDALAVIAALAVGYFAGWLRASLRHQRATENLGAHLKTLCEFPTDDKRRREMLLRLADGLMRRGD